MMNQNINDLKKAKIGFFGLGAMGQPMTINLCQAGFSLICYDVIAERANPCVVAGARTAANAAELIEACDIIFLSLPTSEVLVETAVTHFYHHAKPNQIFIDTGTTTAPSTRQLADLFATKQTVFLDAPVSGGGIGAQQAELFIWIGGEERAAKRCWPLFVAIGAPERITYMGESGNGQIAKGVNQLVQGLENAVYLEAFAFGIHAGLSPEQLEDGFHNRFKGRFARALTAVSQNRGEKVSVYYNELYYCLTEAIEKGFSLPITQAVYDVCEAGEHIYPANRHGLVPSFWQQLMKKEVNA